MRLTAIRLASRRMPDYHNMPRRFIERHTTFLAKRAPRLPQYTQKIFRYKLQGYYDQWRPWEEEFTRLNQDGAKVSKIYVEPIRTWSYFRGDRVEVLKGKDKGKQGIINYIVKERNWVFVQGLNLSRKIINKTPESVGNLVTREDPYLIDIEVKLVDPSDLQPTDIEWAYDDDGNKVRVSTRTGRTIRIPDSAYETIDYVEKDKYVEQPKDTKADLVKKSSYVPQAKTFEMDICDEMGIKDTRVPYPMFWY